MVVANSYRSHFRLALAALSVFLIAAFLTTSAAAQSSVRPPASAVNNTGTSIDTNDDFATHTPLGQKSDADLWRYLKSGGGGAPVMAPTDQPLPATTGRPENLAQTFLDAVTAPPSEIKSTTTRTSAIQVLGEDWRLIRLNYILVYSPWILVAIVCLIALFGIVRGRIRIRAGRSGKTIPRFSMSHRIAHWFLASTFILMGLSGLLIMMGRPHLAPLIGLEANAVIVSAAMQGHNLFGPVFILALLIMILRFVRGNFFQWADLKWILKGGGLIGGHASSNHYNFGEKTWYWIVVIVGLTMSATGLFLLFPMLSENLAWHQLSTILHAGGAILMIAIALGHAYIGSIGMEGSLDSMLRGDVDENWAKEHHDLWYEQVTGKQALHPEDESHPAEEQTA